MKEHLAYWLMVTASYLPLRVAHALGRGIGHLAWKLDKKSRRTSLVNLRIAYPEKSPEWHEEIAKKSFLAMGEGLLESPRLWRLSGDKLESLLLNPEALEEIKKTHAHGNGVVLAIPHQGSWEFLGLVAALHMPMTSLFRPPRLKKITPLIKEGREHTGATLVPTDTSGVKSLMKALKNGHCSGILPDQKPDTGGGVEVNFFGHPAYTMQLLPKLVARNKTPVIFTFAERAKNGEGFTLRCIDGSTDLYEKPLSKACQSMNEQLEALIRLCPEQYNWAYRRFRGINTKTSPYD